MESPIFRNHPYNLTNLAIQTIHSVDEMRAFVLASIRSNKSTALVPTMGALHEGHLALVHRAADEADVVIVSIFVNPTQFGPGEDFDAYPRLLEQDVAALDAQGLAAVVFAPPVSEIYSENANLTWVEVDSMGESLCGASRPGHFKGVTTIVSRLFAIIQPDYAVFGLKDAQQFFILSRMSQDMGFATRLIGVDTIREDDGVAMSSRNRYLNAEQRIEARVLSQAVNRARYMIETNGVRDTLKIKKDMVDILQSASSGRLDYAEIVDADTLKPVENLETGQTILAAVAMFFQGARLIDNSISEVR